jgi:hypothetical protein
MMGLLPAIAVLPGSAEAHPGLLKEPPSAPVTRWNLAMVGVFRRESTPPGLAARNLALIHCVIHDTLACVAKEQDFLLLEKFPAFSIQAGLESAAVAAHVAGHEICRLLSPGNSAEFDKLLGADPPESPLGRAVARAIMTLRGADGASSTRHYVPQNGPAAWRRTGSQRRPPELPHWPQVKPFLLKSAAQFRPPPPPAPTSEIFQNALREVRRIGGKNSAARTKKQSLIARFWSDFNYTCTPPGHWNEIAREMIGKEKIDLRQSARIMAVLNLALSEAGLAAFDCKYHYHFWRPVSAINWEDHDSNWQSLLPNPPHPEYVSAHSTFSAAAAGVLESYFKKAPFSVGSDSVLGVKRSFKTFQECAAEIGQSRLFGGIHYQFSNLEGLALGKKVAIEVLGKAERRK